MKRCLPLVPACMGGHRWDWLKSDDTDGTACCTSTVRVPCKACPKIKTVTVDLA